MKDTDNNNQVEYILLDLGGVLYDLDIIANAKKLFPGLMDGQIMQKWRGLNSLKEYEKGFMTEQDFMLKAVHELGLTITPGEFLENFKLWLGRPYEGAEAVLQKIHEHWRLGCLSNTNPTHIELSYQQGDLLNLFDERYFSYELGFHKPDPMIFKMVIQKIGLAAQKIAFLDDNEENVAAARQVGMVAHQCVGVEALRFHLENKFSFAPSATLPV